MLWAIPKNLVYVFLFVIIFAFLGMLYITYTEKDLTDFVTYDRTKEVVVIDPVFYKLRETLELDKFFVPNMTAAEIDLRTFNSDFMTKNRPLLLKDYAAEWGATKKWSDKQYLSEVAGDSIVRLTKLNRSKKDFRPFSYYFHQPQKVPSSLKNALIAIENNTNTIRGY